MEILNQLQAVHLITTEAEHQAAGELWKASQAELKAIDLKHADDIDFAHREHKRLIAVRDEVKKPIEEAAKKVKGLMADYQAECRRKAAEEARRLEAEARKREEERKLQEAIAVADAGDTGGADAIMDEPITVSPVFVAPPPKVQGVVFREVWQFEVVNLGQSVDADLIAKANDLLILADLEDEYGRLVQKEGCKQALRDTINAAKAALPREYMVPDEKKIGQVVRAMKGLTSIPGVRAFSKKV